MCTHLDIAKINLGYDICRGRIPNDLLSNE